MIRVFILLVSLSLADSVSANECDCSTYPFKPNPPCFSTCVANLSSRENTELPNLKHIDPLVARVIEVFSENKKLRDAVNFDNINGIETLGQEGKRALEHSGM